MSRWLLDVLGSVRGSLFGQLVVALVALGLMPPALIVDGMLLLCRIVRVRRVLAIEEVRCPRGHAVSLVSDSWTCPVCKLTHTGHGFAPCPHCGTIPHAINCPCCLPVVNPLSPVRTSRQWLPGGGQ